MAKATPNDVLDVFLEDIATADTLVLCSDQPANFAGISAVALADATLTPGAGNGDFTLGSGTPSGRALTVGAQEDFEVDDTGETDHVVLADSSESRLLYVTTCTPQGLTQGNTVSTGSWTVTLPQPS